MTGRWDSQPCVRPPPSKTDGKTKNKPDTGGATASEAYYAPLLFNTDL